MYGLNALALVYFMGISILAHFVRKRNEMQKAAILRAACMILLLMNTIHLAGQLPKMLREHRGAGEFFSVACITVPLVFLLNWNRFRQWAAYTGLLAGFFWCVMMIVIGGTVYENSSPLNVYRALISYGGLYVCGLVALSEPRCHMRNRGRLVWRTLGASFSTLPVHVLYQGSKRTFISVFQSHKTLCSLFSESRWPWLLMIYGTATLVFLCVLLARSRNDMNTGAEEAISAI